MSMSRTATPASLRRTDADADNADGLMPPLSTPLNAKAGGALLDLIKNNCIKDLRKHLQFAVEKLAESAGEINERVTDGKLRYEKTMKKRAYALKQQQQAKNRGGGEGEDNAEEENDDNNHNNKNANQGKEQVEDEAEKQRLADYEERVKQVTGRLDEKLRDIIDVNARVDGFADVVKEIAKEVVRDAQIRQTQQAQRQQQQQQQVAGRRRRVVDDGEDEDDEDGDGQMNDAAAEDEQPPPEPPSKKVREHLDKHMRERQQLSMTERYAMSNAYEGFYRIVHEAKHPQDEIPPLPDKSTWFLHLEKTKTNRDTTSNTEDAASAAEEEEEDVDIAVSRERVSLKCPLTQQMFVNPVRNTKCVHAFERSAIEEFIDRSPMTVPVYDADPDETNQNQRPRRAGAPLRVKAAECPVCSAVITKADLRRDPVLMRRVRRAQMAAQGEGEDEEEEEDEEQEEAAPVVTKTEDGARVKAEKSGSSGRRPRTLYIDDDAIED